MHFLFSLFSSEHDWALPCAIAHKAFSLTPMSLGRILFGIFGSTIQGTLFGRHIENYL
jgi:hypothetical protein